MGQIAGLGEREIISVAVGQVYYTDQGIESVNYPDDKSPFWVIGLKDGTTILATGDVALHFR